MLDKHKICSKCGIIGPEELFKPSRNICLECYKKRQKDWFEKNKEEILQKSREEFHSTPVEVRFSGRLQGLHKKSSVWFEKLLCFQEYRCAICRTDKAGGQGFWHLDHDHETGECRGFLCHNCNVGIGHLKEQESILLAAVAYLKYPPSRDLGEDVWWSVKPNEKTCGKCEKIKNLDDFHKSKNGSLGRAMWCKECMKEYRREDHLKNRERDLADSKAWHKQNNAKLAEHNYEDPVE